MRAIVKPQPAPGAVLTSAPVPRVGPNECLVKVLACAICGTDVHIYNWDAWAQSRIRTPRIFGHEFCGEVVEVGSSVTQVRPGDFVSAEMHYACGTCYWCRTGQAHICQDVRIAGVDADGCFADYVAVPAQNVWKMAGGIPLEVAAIQDPLGNAVHTVFVNDIPGSTVAVMGCGPIGLCAVAVCRFVGARAVYALEVNSFRLELATRMGATACWNPAETDPVERVADATGGVGVDVVLEMSGHPRGISDAFKMLRKGGQMAMLGIPSRPVELDLANDVVFKGVRVQGVNGRRMFETWYRAQGLLEAGLDVSPVITHRFQLSDYESAFALARGGDCGKIIMYPDRGLH